MRRAVLLVLALAGCGGAPATSDEMYIAQQSDFASYMTWGAIDLGMATDTTGHPVGEEYGYRNKQPKGGKYPVGTILVKEIHVDDVETDWELFAMVKRGGDYNAGGAVGWEYFTLRLNAQDIPIIETRGPNPADTDSNGHGYGQAENGVTCNRCHAAPGNDVNDYTLSAGLRP